MIIKSTHQALLSSNTKAISFRPSSRPSYHHPSRPSSIDLFLLPFPLTIPLLLSFSLSFLVLIILSLALTIAQARERLEYPTWFTASLYDLPGDLEDAVARGKRGIALFFSAESCLHCIAMGRSTFLDPEVVRRLSGQYDVMAVDVFSDVLMVDLEGNTLPARELSERERATFTPTLLFINASGDRMLRHIGFVNAERMHHILDYLETDSWRSETLREYLQRNETALPALAGSSSSPNDITTTSGISSQLPSLITDSISESTGKSLTYGHSSTMPASLPGFQTPPADLMAQRKANPRPALVLFDYPECLECQQLRELILIQPEVQHALAGFHVLRLQPDDTTPAVLPDGRYGTPSALAAELGLTHEPSLVFFADDGSEAFRMDSPWLIDYSGAVLEQHREASVASFLARLEYVASGDFREWPQYQRWRAHTQR